MIHSGSRSKVGQTADETFLYIKKILITAKHKINLFLDHEEPENRKTVINSDAVIRLLD